MENIEVITRYFDLTESQRSAFEALGTLYPQWNAAINVISRKDIGNLYTNHILHSLAIARFLGPLAPGSSFIDMGTGGGFPGIPLAIMYPQCRFHLVDRIAKKLRVASSIAGELGLDNVTIQHGDILECKQKVDYVVSRAVMQLDGLLRLVSRNIARPGTPGNRYSPGLICLKGGDLTEEIAAVHRYSVADFPLNEFFNEDFFSTKSLIYVPI